MSARRIWGADMQSWPFVEDYAYLDDWDRLGFEVV